jgi:hypothetical protein
VPATNRYSERLSTLCPWSAHRRQSLTVHLLLPWCGAVFDYVILGSGSAGSVLADRLSATPRNEVRLVEAGAPDRNPLFHLPRASPS